MKKKLLLTMLVAVMGAGLYVGHVLATPSAGLTTTIYAKSLFDPVKLKGFALLPKTDQQKGNSALAQVWGVRMRTHGLTDAYVVDNKIAPGRTTGWHSHPGPSMIFVVAGTVTNYEGDYPTCTAILTAPEAASPMRVEPTCTCSATRAASRRRRSPSSSCPPGQTGGSTSRIRVTARPELRQAGGGRRAHPPGHLGEPRVRAYGIRVRRPRRSPRSRLRADRG